MTDTTTARSINLLAGGGGIDIASAANVFTLAQQINGAGALTKLGAGTLQLDGNNLYGGGTTVSAGTLSVRAATALGGGTVTLAGGSLLAGVNNLTLTNAFTLAGGALALGSNTLTLTGIIGGSGALIQTGIGDADPRRRGQQLHRRHVAARRHARARHRHRARQTAAR